MAWICWGVVGVWVTGGFEGQEGAFLLVLGY